LAETYNWRTNHTPTLSWTSAHYLPIVCVLSTAKFQGHFIDKLQTQYFHKNHTASLRSGNTLSVRLLRHLGDIYLQKYKLLKNQARFQQKYSKKITSTLWDAGYIL